MSANDAKAEATLGFDTYRTFFISFILHKDKKLSNLKFQNKSLMSVN